MLFLNTNNFLYFHIFNSSLEKMIKQKIASDDFINEKVEKIIEIKGVGIITVAVISKIGR